MTRLSASLMMTAMVLFIVKRLTDFGSSARRSSVVPSSQAACSPLQRHIRDPDIPVGVDQVGFAQAVRLVGRRGQHRVAAAPGAGGGSVGVTAMQAKLEA